MAEAGVEFWIVDSKEYGEDIVWRSIAPAHQVNARRRTVTVYKLLPGGNAVERRDFVASPSLVSTCSAWSDIVSPQLLVSPQYIIGSPTQLVSPQNTSKPAVAPQ